MGTRFPHMFTFSFCLEALGQKEGNGSNIQVEGGWPLDIDRRFR